MIKAKLPQGDVLGFPDGTPENVISMAVKRYLNIQTPEPPTENNIDKKLDEIQTLVKDVLSGNKNTNNSDIANVLTNINETFGLLLNKDKDREHNHNLVMSLESLNVLTASLFEEIKSIKEENKNKFDEITRILSAPRKLIKDANGNPTGSKLDTEIENKA